MKTLKLLRTFRLASVVLVVMGLPALNSNANSVIYQFAPVSPGAVPGSPASQVEATFQDTDPGKVLLTISTANLINGEFLSDLYFNFDPADQVNRLHITRWDRSGGPLLAEVTTGDDSFAVGGYGDYDIHFAFSATSSGKSSGANSVMFQITEPGLHALDFAFSASFGNTGTFYALARIQGSCRSSQWLDCSSTRPQPVPEPASIGFLVLAAGAGCAGLREKRTTRTRSGS